MEELRENPAKYMILTLVGISFVFALDHYVLGDGLNVFVGCVIGIAPTFLMMLRDVLRDADTHRSMKNEPFIMTKKRGLLMLIALLPQVLFVMALTGYVLIFFIDRSDIRIFVGAGMSFVLIPVAGWYGGKKWDILFQRFREEDKVSAEFKTPN